MFRVMVDVGRHEFVVVSIAFLTRLTFNASSFIWFCSLTALAKLCQFFPEFGITFLFILRFTIPLRHLAEFPLYRVLAESKCHRCSLVNYEIYRKVFVTDCTVFWITRKFFSLYLVGCICKLKGRLVECTFKWDGRRSNSSVDTASLILITNGGPRAFLNLGICSYLSKL